MLTGHGSNWDVVTKSGEEDLAMSRSHEISGREQNGRHFTDDVSKYFVLKYIFEF